MSGDIRGDLIIATPADWDRILDVVSGFHDGVVKTLELTHKDSVNIELKAHTGRLPDMRVVLQFQSRAVPAVELRFGDVRQLTFDAELDYQDQPAIFTGGIGRFRFLACDVVAATAAFKMLDVSYLDP